MPPDVVAIVNVELDSELVVGVVGGSISVVVIMNRVKEGQSTNTVGIYPHASVHVIAKFALKAEVDIEGNN